MLTKNKQVNKKLFELELRVQDLEDFLEVRKWLQKKTALPVCCFDGNVNCKKTHWVAH